MSELDGLVDKVVNSGGVDWGDAEDRLGLALKRALDMVERAKKYDLHLNDPEDTLADVKAILEGTYNESCGAI